MLLLQASEILLLKQNVQNILFLISVFPKLLRVNSSALHKFHKKRSIISKYDYLHQIIELKITKISLQMKWFRTKTMIKKNSNLFCSKHTSI